MKLKLLLASLLLVGATTGTAVADVDGNWHQLTVEQMIAEYNKAVPDLQAGQPDVKKFADQLTVSWGHMHHQTPSYAFIGCMLYQIGGYETLKRIRYATLNEELNDTEERAFAYAKSLSPDDHDHVAQLLNKADEYATGCNGLLSMREFDNSYQQ